MSYSVNNLCNFQSFLSSLSRASIVFLFAIQRKQQAQLKAMNWTEKKKRKQIEECS